MSTPVTVSLDGRVAVIRIDNPPVNALSPQVVEALPAALAQAAADPAVAGIVLAGAGRTFVAGADIKGLEDVVWGAESGAPDMHGFLASIENCPKPVVMAMHGTALGGGLEVAMAGHYRVAVPDAQLGLPEVNLGIIPGAEGTQRLPRLVGVETALTMCVSGRPVKAAEALQSGLVDRVVDDLIPGAVAFANEVVARGGPHPKTSERTDKLPAPDALPAMVAAAHELARKVRRHQTAPARAIAAIEAAATLPFDEGRRRERELFFECARSEQAKALIHGFFAERAVAKVPGIGKDVVAPPVSTVAIVGAGTMGSGIAMAVCQRRPDRRADRHRADGARSSHDDDPQELRQVGEEGTVHRGRGGRAHRAHPAPGGLRGLRHGGRHRRSGVREHGAQEGRAGDARSRGASRVRCWPPTPPRSTSTHWRPRRGGRKPSSACTSSARPT